MALHPTTCPLDCPDACGVLVETDDAGGFVGVRGNPAHSYSKGALCGKTAIYGDVVRSTERLREPLLRRADGGFEPVSWERALDTIVERVAPLRGEEILALSYGGCMGLVARSYPKRILHALGATETDGAICDTSATIGYETVLGHVVGPDIETLAESDALVLWGIDMKRTMQHLQPQVRELSRRGAPVFAIDIYRTDTIRALERQGGTGLVVRPGTDPALALGLARLAYERGRDDESFLADECVGSAEFREHVLAGHGLDEVAAITGLRVEQIEELADKLFSARHPFIKVGVGFARRRKGAMNMRSVCSLAAVLGCTDTLHYESADHFGIDVGMVERRDLRPADAPVTPIQQVKTGAELESGRFRAVFVWGHNPAETIPDSNRVRAGLAREDVFVVVHEQFMTETARLADVVLPATTFVEQSDVYRSYGHRLAQYGRKAVDAPHEQRSNVEAFAALARALGLPREVWDVSEESLCREVLEAARERIGDADLQRLFTGEPVKLRPREFADRGTPSGKIELWSEAARAAGEPPMATWVADDGSGGKGRFNLIAAPSKATHNTTFTGSSRHVQRAGRPLCLVHPSDADELGIVAGDTIRLRNEQGKITLEAALSDDMPPGMLRVDGFPRPDQLPERVGINALASPELTDLGESNVLYSTRVDLEKCEPTWTSRGHHGSTTR